MKKIVLLCLVLMCIMTGCSTSSTSEIGLVKGLAKRVTTRDAFDPNVQLTDDQTELILQAGFSAPTGVN